MKESDELLRNKQTKKVYQQTSVVILAAEYCVLVLCVFGTRTSDV